MAGDVDMKNEYDFTDGKRGKHYKEYRKGHKVIISQEDGSELVHYFSRREGSVILDPDLKPYYPDDESVNRALRSLVRESQAAVSERQIRRGSWVAASMSRFREAWHVVFFLNNFRQFAYYLHGRYPTFKEKLSSLIDKKEANNILEKSKETFKWLKSLKK